MSAGGLSAGGATQPPAWGPGQLRAAVAITFDNLGEASDLERGRWPQDEPLGRHASVTRALPRVLGLLSELRLRATFFVEGLNAQLYPQELQMIAAAGHEVAYHGWRHEHWVDLTPARERESLDRGLGALEQLGLRPVGFRPPGGRLARSSARALKQAGFAYCSPAGEGVAMRDGLVVLPFRWTLTDAFYYLPGFAPRRQAALGAPDPLPPDALRAALAAALPDAVGRGAFLAPIFHPFLADSDDRLAAMHAFMGELRELVDEGRAWCAPLREIAAWVCEQRQARSWSLQLDRD